MITEIKKYSERKKIKVEKSQGNKPKMKDGKRKIKR